MTYDGLDRPKTTSATTLGTITQNYDAGGRRTSLVDTTGTTSFTPDGLGRIKQVNAPNTGIIQYTYNGRGDRTKVVYPSPNSTTFNYTYLNDGRVQQVTQGAGLTPVARYNYDAVGRLVQAVSNTNAALNSQLITNYRYDGADRLRALRSSEAGTTVSGFQYDTDRLGLRTTITETLPLSPTLSTTRIKTMTFNGGSLTDAATGADSTLPNPTTLTLTTTGALKGGYSMVVPKIANSYLREDFTAANEVYVTLYLRVDALPSANTRLLQINNGTTGLGDLQLLTNGKLRMHNSGTTIGLDSSALTVGAVYRVGIHQKSGSGTGVLEAFLASGDNQFTSAFAVSSTLTISLAASRVQVGATVSSNILAITADEITIDTAGFAQPSVNSLRASAAPAASGSAASTTTIDPLAAQATGGESAGRMAAFSRLPITFIPNAGQTDPSVRMQARGLHGNLFFGAGELTLALRPPTRDKTPTKPANPLRQRPKAIPLAVLQQRWIGAKPTAEVTGTLKLPGRANFLIGNDPNKWRSNLATFADMLTRQLYDGIDLYYTGLDGQLKTTYVVAPGADSSRIRWRYQGADSVTVDASGNLVVRMPAPSSTLTDTEVLSSTLTELAPVATQTVNEREVSVPVRFEGGPDGSVSFALGAYDPTQPLIIDPTLVYSAPMGGFGDTDSGYGIAVDAAGNSYVTGVTTSSDFVTTAGSVDPTFNGPFDAFVAKLNSTGSAFIYSTFLGGTTTGAGAGANALALDSSGNVYITGWTDSTDFPTTTGAYDRSCGAGDACDQGVQDAFVTKLNSSGSALVYSTYLGASSDDVGKGIAVDSAGNAYITGPTSSSTFPTTTGAYNRTYTSGVTGSFITKLNSAGSGLSYSTFAGGTSAAIVLDSAGNAYITGETSSTSFPTTTGAYDRTCGTDNLCNQDVAGPHLDAFVTKLNAAGSGLSYSTYLGGGSDDSANDIAIDAPGNIYVTGMTSSTNYPTASALRSASGGAADAFVTKLNTTGSSLAYSTYLGGNGDDYGNGITVDGAGNAYITGETWSTNFITTTDAFQSSLHSPFDAFITEISGGGNAALYSTYLGGSNGDRANAIAVDSASGIYLTGTTFSRDFVMTTNATHPPIGSGDTDAFVVKLGMPAQTNSYIYDGLQRLIVAVEGTGNIYNYGYDLAGNRQTVTVNGTTTTISYNYANEIP